MKKKRKNSKQFDRMFKKRFFTKKSVTILVFTLIIISGLGIGCHNQRKRAKEYEKTIQELNTEIDDLNNANETLEEEKNNVDSAEFKERMARERLGMIGEDEYSLEQSERDNTEEDNKEQDNIEQGNTEKDNTKQDN